MVAKPSSHIHGQVEFREEREREQADQFVHTLDGQPALIETGAVRPLAFGYSGYVTYQPATADFAVIPRLTAQGNVQLSIAPWVWQV